MAFSDIFTTMFLLFSKKDMILMSGLPISNSRTNGIFPIWRLMEKTVKVTPKKRRKMTPKS